ncbi:hypothetical protein [Embleya sp. MST-111070]
MPNRAESGACSTRGTAWDAWTAHGRVSRWDHGRLKDESTGG